MKPLHTSFAGLALAATALLASNASAQQVCYSDSIPLTTTNWNHTVTIPRFDPAMGILQSIDFELSGTIDGSAKFESLDNAPSNVTMSFQGQLVLTRPNLTQLVVVLPVANFANSVTAYDGTTDFGGTSGVTYPSVNASQTNMATSPRPVSDLTLFSGPSGNPGTIVLPVSASGTSVASGAGNLITQFQQKASAIVRVCYHFLPDCNHNGIPDGADVQGGMLDVNNDGIPDECQPTTTRFCEGDGAANGGNNCPCNNNAPQGSPGGCINQIGISAILTATGVPSVSNDTLHLTATNMPTGAGFFFQGTAETTGGTPFGNGLRCIGGTVVRINKIPTDSGGTTLPAQNGPPISVLLGITEGETRVYQVWYRDHLNVCGQPLNTTNAIRVTWGL